MPSGPSGTQHSRSLLSSPASYTQRIRAFKGQNVHKTREQDEEAQNRSRDRDIQTLPHLVSFHLKMILTRLAIGALCLVSLLPSLATCLHVPPAAKARVSRQERQAAECVNEEILNAMRSDQSAAASFCREFLPALNVTVTERDVCIPPPPPPQKRFFGGGGCNSY